MKIAITGHTSGIGKSFAKKLSERGHDIVGISRREGENIRRIPHTAKLIEPCDLFINNAQSDFAQTQLLQEVWKMWQGSEKYIWNISTHMTQSPVNTTPDGHGDLDMNMYRIQKQSLEEMSKHLSYKNVWPKVSIIRPGRVLTGTQTLDSGESPDVWVESVIKIFTLHDTISVPDISICYTDKRIKI